MLFWRSLLGLYQCSGLEILGVRVMLFSNAASRAERRAFRAQGWRLRAEGAGLGFRV